MFVNNQHLLNTTPDFQEEEAQISVDRRDQQDIHPRAADHDPHRAVQGPGGGLPL